MQKHRALAKNIFFQDSLYLFPFEQQLPISLTVRAAYSLFLLLWGSSRSWVRTATLETFSAPCIIVVWKTDTLYICFLKWPPQHINGNSNQVRFGMNTTTSWIPKWFLTAQTVDPQRFLSPVPNESIADKHPINIQIFCRKLRFRCQRTLCIIFRVQDQVRYTVWWLHWPVYAL